MTRHAQDTCPGGVTRETLSGWRDALLSAEDARRLGEHISACGPCQATLARFDAVAGALLRQRELEPGDRIVRGVMSRLARRSRRSGRAPVGRLMRGAGTLGTVAALVALFIIVLHTGPGLNGGPAQRMTPTLTQAGTPSPSPSATATTAEAVTIAQAWGADAARNAVTTQIDATHVFEASALTRDGSTLLGSEIALSGGTPTTASAGMLSIASRQFTSIGVSGLGWYPPTSFASDGRYVVTEDSAAPGATCGVCHVRFWAYDLATRHLWQVAVGSDYQGGILAVWFDHGLLLMNTYEGPRVANLATHTVTPLTGVPASGQILAFTWPYVVYNSPVDGATSAITVRARDLVTNTDVALPYLASLYSTASSVSLVNLAITGDTLFYSVTPSSPAADTNMNTLYEVDHFLAPGTQAHRLATFDSNSLGELKAANQRLVLLMGGAWDRVQQRFVAFGTGSDSGGPGRVDAALAGNYLAIFRSTGTQGIPVAEQVSIYDTTRLPTGGA